MCVSMFEIYFGAMSDLGMYALITFDDLDRESLELHAQIESSLEQKLIRSLKNPRLTWPNSNQPKLGRVIHSCIILSV